MSETPPADPVGAAIVSKLNWLRAGVLGANDGIVSTSTIIFGVPARLDGAAPRAIEVWASGGAVLMALALSGWISAGLGGAPRLASIVRTIVGGLLAMGITYGVGRIAGTQV